MEDKKIFNGRGALSGIVEAEAIVCPESIAGWNGVCDVTGEIIERYHSQRGKTIKGKILVLPCSKGSNGWSCHFHAAKINGCGPAGWIFTQIDSSAGVAVAVLDIPTIVGLKEGDPCILIKTGDLIRIDGDKGMVEILNS